MPQQEPLTEQLLDELLSSPSAKAYLDEHTFVERSFSEYLQELLEEKGLERSKVVRAANINETHGYQIFVGQRGASRNKVLQLAFAMGLTLKQTNYLLQSAGSSALYIKNRRDAIITFCLNKEYDLQTTNEQLYNFGEDILD